MTIRIEKLPGAPVILATIDGHIDVETVRALDDETARLRQQLGGDLYRITDIHTLDTTLAEMLAIINQEYQGAPGSITDPRVTTLFVGENKWITFARDALGRKQFGAASIPTFDSVDDALIYIRFQRRCIV